MAIQTLYAGTVTDIEDNDLWINENNAKTNDGLFATCDISDYGISSILKFTNYGFTIPTGAIINSILITKKCKADISGLIYSSSSLLYYSGGFVGFGDDSSIEVTSINTEYEVSGFDGQLWGKTWTASEINNSSFGVEIIFNNNDFAQTVYVDFVSITVDYTASGGGATPFTTVNFH